jgi:hypothetical protein
VMEVGPPGSPCRRRAQTAAVSCRSRAGVGSDCGEGPLSAGQVCDEKTNESEPLMTHRNPSRWHRNRGRSQAPGQRRTVCVPVAGERPACGPGDARCKGGVSSSRALSWNRRTCRLGTDDPASMALVARGRAASGGHRERQSTARHRGGPARSSGDGPVMGPERRGRAGRVTLMPTRTGRS